MHREIIDLTNDEDDNEADAAHRAARPFRTPCCMYCAVDNLDCNGTVRCQNSLNRRCIYIMCQTPRCAEPDCLLMHRNQFTSERYRQPGEPRWLIEGDFGGTVRVRDMSMREQNIWAMAARELGAYEYRR